LHRGDVVELLSGSVSMTVTAIETHGEREYALVVYFNPTTGFLAKTKIAADLLQQLR